MQGEDVLQPVARYDVEGGVDKAKAVGWWHDNRHTLVMEAQAWPVSTWTLPYGGPSWASTLGHNVSETRLWVSGSR